MSKDLHGACYCGATSFTLPDAKDTLTMSAYCHCSRCSRLAGAPFIWTAHWKGKNSVEWTSDIEPAKYEVLQGRKWRLRCSKCSGPIGSWNEAKQECVWSLLEPPLCMSWLERV